MTLVERVARAIANGLGDNFDHAFVDKSEWNAARGAKGGRYRDINEPMQADYINASQFAIEAMRDPTEKMKSSALDQLVWGLGGFDDDYRDADPDSVWNAMLDAALSEQPE